MTLAFQTEALALNPILFWRCKDLAGAPHITDYSVNEYHGTIESGGITLGGPTLVETDEDAHSVFCPNGFANNICTRASPPPAPLLFTGDFSILCFAKHFASTGSGFKYLVARGGIAGSTASGLHFHTTGSSTRSLHAWFRTFDGVDQHLVQVDAETSHLRDVKYFHVVTRAGNVVRLYTNAVLVGENNTADTNPLHLPSSNKLVFGAGANNLAPFHGWASELLIYPYGLTPTQIKTLYESSLLTLRGSVTVLARVDLELNTDQIQPIDFPFAHNFAGATTGNEQPLLETLSFKTNEMQSEPDYQQRINAQPHHVDRVFNYNVSPIGDVARHQLIASLWRPGEIYRLPIWSDWSTLTADADSSDEVLQLDTTLADYEVGSGVYAATDVFDPRTYQYFEIDTVDDGELALRSAVGDPLPLGSLVLPARLARLLRDGVDAESHLVNHESLRLQFELLSTELSTRRWTSYVPATTYRSIEVFSLSPAQVEWLNASTYTIRRRQIGTGIQGGNDHVRGLDTGSPRSVGVDVTLKTKEDRAEFLGWLMARQGKQNPVWISSRESDLPYVSTVASNRIKTRTQYKLRYELHSARRDIEIAFTDGTFSRQRITAVLDNGDGTENLTLSPGSISTIKPVKRVSWLRHVVAPDTFELVYNRDLTRVGGMIVECAFVLQELLTTPS